MDCILMHRDTEVADVSVYGTGEPEFGRVRCPEHLPPGTTTSGRADRLKLAAWWRDRAVPGTRQNIGAFLDAMGIPNVLPLLPGSMGLSLSDHYWIRPADSDAGWSDVNYFGNPFSEDIGDMMFGKGCGNGPADMRSPDLTANGDLMKRWRIVGGERRLIKSASERSPCRQQVFNEAVASKVMERLGIPHAEYSVIWDMGVPYSSCADLADGGTEMVSAYQVYSEFGKDNRSSAYDHYVVCCGRLGLDVSEDLDRMIVADYILMNRDRHLNNFGLMRDSDTLEYISTIPVFDTGSCLGFDEPPDSIPDDMCQTCKPFAKTFDRELGLVKSLDWIDFDSLDKSVDDARRILSDRGYFDPGRADAIVALLQQRIGMLERMSF